MKKNHLRHLLLGLLLAPTIAFAADPQISSFTDSPDPVVTGTNYSYQIVVRNNAPADAANTRLSLAVPSGAVFVSAAPASENCAPASATLIECNLGTVRGGNLDVRTITMVWQATAVGLSTINATATLSADNDDNSTNNVQNQQTTVNPVSATDADLQITSKTNISGIPIAAGANVTFRITPRNAGPAVATGVTVTDVLPTGWSFVSAAGTNWSCSAAGQTVTCSRASLPVGAGEDIDIVATAPASVALGGSAYTNTATIAGTTVDPVPGNNSASATGSVLANGADLSLSKTKLPLTVASGGTLTSTINVTNLGPATATGNVRVVEVLSNETFVGAAGSGWSCTASGSVVVCNHANAGGMSAFGALPTLTITTTATGAGPATNTACTGGSVPSGAGGATATPPAAGDPNPLNDCGTTSSAIGSGGGGADLSVVSVTTTTPSGGDKRVSTSETSVTFTSVIRNDGPAAATGATIDFSGIAQTGTPLSFAVTAPPGVSFACASPPLRCTQTSGSLAAGASVTVAVTASRPLPTFGSPGTTQTFTTTVSNVVENDPNPANNTGSDTFSIDSMTDLQVVSKTVSPSIAAAGDLVTYAITIRNNGPDNAFAFDVVDTFTFPGAGDPGFDVVSIAYSQPAFGSCTAAAAITPASPSVRCTITLMSSGQTEQITMAVRPRSDLGNPSRVLRNSATLSGGSVADSDTTNDAATAELTVRSSPIDLLVNKVDVVDPVPFVDGATFVDYRVRVTNNGPTAGTGVRITETTTPPAGKRIRFVCDTTGFGSASCNPISLCSATNVVSAAGTALPAITCSAPADGGGTSGPTVGNLANGASKDIFLRYEILDRPPLSGDVFTSTSSVTSDQFETFVANNSITELTTTRNRIDIRVSKAASAASVSVSQPFNWVVTVVNNGPGDSLQTDLTDTLPAGTTVTGPITWSRSLPAGSGTCSVAGLTVSCALGRLNGTGAVTVTIPVRLDSVPAGGVATNTATVDVDPAKTGAEDLPGGNNTGSATVTVSRSSLSGTVFEDRVRSGGNAGTPQAAGSEPRLAGVALRLTGTDNLGNAVDRTATTDGDGRFTFADLPPSNGAGYRLEQTQPTGYVNGPSDPPATGAGAPSIGGTYSRGGASGNSSYAGVVLGTGVDAVDYNFPELRRPGLSGFVYADIDTNGVRDPAIDAPLAGATVRLLDATTLSVLATATTDPSGAYSFGNLDPLTAYTLEQPLPTGAGTLANGPVNPGLIGGAACASGCAAQANTPVVDTDRIAAIDLSAGADGTQFNFGEVQVTAISGTVYVDRNRNGALDATPTDGRLAGVTLSLYSGTSCSGVAQGTASTDATGAYSFSGLVAGRTYTVCQTQPAGYGDGGVNPGTAASSPGPNALTVTSLPVAGSAGNHFAERIGSIAGAVYLDANNDGVRQAGEAGIGGVQVTLAGTDATGAPVSRSATTDTSGAFRFDDVVGSAAGGYSLTQQAGQPVVGGVVTLDGRTTAGNVGGLTTGTAGAPGTTPSTIAAVVLAGGALSVDHLFGEILPVSIGGIVFSDANNNGQQDLPADPGLSGVTITLSGTDDLGAAVSRTLTTALDGSFSVSGLRPGTYALTQPTQPPGTSNGLTVPGSAGGTATGVATTPSAITGIVLTTPGSASSDNRFAERPDSGVISGRVWIDADNDGVVDGSESGIAGQTIQLGGTDTLGNPVSRTATTAADGSYAFTGLAPGTYSVTQPVQPADTYNGRTVAGTAGGSATAVGTLPSAVSGIVLGAGQSSLDNNFAELTGGQVTGRVWFDANNDGVIGAGESGLSGVTIQLAGTDLAGNPVSRSTATGSDGRFAFADVPSGTYTLTQPTQPPGTFNGLTVAGSGGGTATGVGTLPSAISGIVLSAGQTAADNNFGETASGQIGGRVWLDANGNGVLDAGESGLSGVTLTLTGTDALGNAVSATITTAADGSYAFTGLRPGSYAVTQPTQPAGTLNGATLPGTGGGTATPASTTPSAITGIVLGASPLVSNNDFAELPGARIAGRVWIDTDNDGVIDVGESGLPGVVLALSGTNDIGASVSATATTGADGSFEFSGLRPGTYTVTEPVQPAGTFNGITRAGSGGGTATGVGTLPSAIAGIVLAAGQAALANDFGELTGAQISGRVWTDSNDNGVVDSGEIGLGGVALTLTGTDDLGAAVNQSLSTGADGSYVFGNLRPGTYTVTEPAQPAGTLNGRTVAGSTGGTATGVATLPSAISGIVLAASQASSGNNFGEIPGAQIAGRVWLDANHNGVVDAGESGMAGVSITLSGTDDVGASVSRTATTGADGSYAFTGLRPGTYAVTEPVQPAGTLNGRTVAGTAGGAATGVGTLPSAISGIVLAASQASSGNNFGEIPGAQIAGRVWLDADHDGVIDAGESGISGVSITLSGTDDVGASVSQTATTGADGSYAFSGLRPGTYAVTEPAQPAGTLNGRTLAGTAGGTATGVGTLPSAIGGIVLTASQVSSGNNFGEIPGAQIAGRVWLDADHDGVIDAGESGISGVSITLAGTDDLGASVSRTATTGTDGRYAFTGLRPGTYAVTEPAQPAGTLNGRTLAGTTGGTATGMGTLPSAIGGIVLAAAQQSADNNFGEIPASQLSGRVWGDANNDGQIGTGEVGLAGVSMVLSGTDDIGNAVTATATSGADGGFVFGGLRPGSYVLTQPTQPPGTSNGVTLAGTAGGVATPVSLTPSAVSGITLGAGVSAGSYLFGEIPDSADLLVSKSHAKAFTVGFNGRYRITVRNGGSVASSGTYTVQDRLPAGLALAATPTGSGWSCAGAAGATSFSCTSSVVIPPGATRAEAIDVVVTVAAAAAAASPVHNVVLVEGGGEVPARGPSAAERDAFQGNPSALPACVPGVTHNACRDATVVQQAASVSGTVWSDSGSTPRVLDAGDRRLRGWLVEVLDLAGNTIVGRATTAADGRYRVDGLEPATELAIRFREPASGVVFGYPVNGETAPGSSGASCVSGTPAAGTPSSCVQAGATPQLVVVLVPGTLLPQQSLPVTPTGVVYDSALRSPVPGSVVTLAPTGSCPGWDPRSAIAAATLGGYSVSGSGIAMTVGPEGFYQFLAAPAAPASCNFGLSVTPPTGYLFASSAIPPTAGPLSPPGGAGAVFAVQPQATAPSADPGPATTYYLALALGSGTAIVVHNHVPLDPAAIGALTLTKTGDRSVAEIGDSVRYTLTVTQAPSGGRPVQTTVVDRLPAGFTFIPGTATVNDVPIADPAGGVGPTLVFNLGPMPPERQLVLRYRVRVGVGALEGDGVNRAQGHACQQRSGCVDASRNPIPSAVSTNPAQFRVRVLGGVFTTEACVLGKIFVDCNRNHVQDPEELGLPGVRLVLSDGTLLISDSEGKYSICGLPPRSHVLRVDPSTLPRGARLTTSSNRNLGDAGSLWLDLKNGELHRADFVEGSCSNTVLEQTKARRAQGEVRSVETEKKGGPALRFDSKAHGLDTLRSPQQGTDGANQQAPKPRGTAPRPPSPAKDETNVPTPDLPMNQPPPRGRSPGDPPDAPQPAGATTGGASHGTR